MEAISRFSKVRTAKNTQSIDIAPSILTFQDHYIRYIDLNSPGQLRLYWCLGFGCYEVCRGWDWVWGVDGG